MALLNVSASESCKGSHLAMRHIAIHMVNGGEGGGGAARGGVPEGETRSCHWSASGVWGSRSV